MSNGIFTYVQCKNGVLSPVQHLVLQTSYRHSGVLPSATLKLSQGADHLRNAHNGGATRAHVRRTSFFPQWREIAACAL